MKMSWDSKELAERIKAAIIENTLAGKDKHGKDFKPYSTRPFAMPYGAVANKKKLEKAIKDNQASVHRHKKTKGLWITWLEGGYKRYKQTMFGGKNANANLPNLWATGGMLKSFTRLKVANKGASDKTYKLKTSFGDFDIPLPQEVHITLGWTDKEKAKIAYYNKLKGRDMFGLPPKQLNDIVKKMLDEVQK